MAETKARGVVGPVLDYFALHPSAFHCYLDESIRISVPLATILQDGIEETGLWLRRPGIDSFNKLHVIEALGELARREPSCRPRILGCMTDLVSFMLECDPSENIADSIVVSALIWELAHLRVTEHFALIELAFERGLVARSHVGDLGEVKNIIFSNEPPLAALQILSPLEINRGYLNEPDGEEVDESEMFPPPDYRFDNHDSPFAPAVPLVGRNDPCPCGSGKKYKKCCMR